MPMLSRISLLMIAAIAVNAAADEPKPQAVRTILERHDQTGVPGKEILIGTAILPPGAVIGFHTHPGDEAGYVVKGDLGTQNAGSAGSGLESGRHLLQPARRDSQRGDGSR
jgi:quercetin dioxygenase-like cupin family protein